MKVNTDYSGPIGIIRTRPNYDRKRYKAESGRMSRKLSDSIQKRGRINENR